MIYFDHNATTPVDDRVIEVMLPYLTSFYGNPSSLYRLGRVVRSAIDTAREQVATLVDAQPSQIIFTSGGTEANNLALNSADVNSIIAISAVEHPSIIEPANRYKRCLNLAVNDSGLLALSTIKALFQQADKPGLISVIMANNETGVIQPIKQIADYLKDQQCIMHTDAVQAVGKIPVSFSRLGVDMMSLSSHKIYGPKGCGALVVDKLVRLEPLLVGGGQENNWRSGTENVAAIVGFGKAAELVLIEMEERKAHSLLLREQLEQGIKSIPGSVIFAEQAERLPNTVQFGLKGVDGEMLLMQLDQKNIAVSSGSACASGGGKASAVLTAIGVEEKMAKSAIRVSLGKDNTEAEIKQFISVLKSFVMKAE